MGSTPTTSTISETENENAGPFQGRRFFGLSLRSRQTLRLRLNIDNVLGEDRFIVTDATQICAYRAIFQTPRPKLPP